MGQNKINGTEYLVKRDNRICGTFHTLRLLFPDEMNDSGEYIFKGRNYTNYLRKSNYTDIDKINGYCLWLFKQFYGDRISFSNNVNNNMYVVTSIFGWLSYKLNQKAENGITKLDDFYNKYMQSVEEYNTPIENDTQYKTYIDFINKNKELMNIDIKVMSKFYDALKNLCKMYSELLDAKYKGDEYLKYVNNFADNYNILFNDTNSNLLKQILSAASNDYNYIKNELNVESIKNQFPELQKEKKEIQVPGPISVKSNVSDNLSGMSSPSSDTKVSDSETEVLNSETTLSSSLIINKLISIPFILVVTLISLGIAYKYSLFGFWKRSKKQHLREKLKK
ncbi:PIR protein [Plasmodium yoelii]|uniref:PIR protein n=2 Tax=Plasmodium yoelii TaxID=5861 RepID=A0AAE9WSX8_PLAYO|nr:PIR protein [Plasmodium yoelii]WBY55883.1 PIR protein [Plasmodium yoelii yoelii]CDU16878.1 YIR protein [Plasmodium yoelii]VTZ75132.1 PIR protein [Plasmodium yoelii]|eukprot:XP_022813113.1 PIR protein [Plasmodium yoelii]